MTYFVYMLKNIDRKSSKTYVGFTNNVNVRLKKHNTNKGAKSTKGYKWVVIYKKRFINKKDALTYEYSLKKDKKKRKTLLDDFNKSKN